MSIDLRSVRDLVHAAADELRHYLPGAHPLIEDRTRCVLPGKPHHVLPGLLVCEQHLQQLSATLRDIEDEALHLAVAPSQAITYEGGGSGTLASQRSPIRLGARVLRDRRRGTGVTRGRELDETAWDPTPSVLESLHAWARLVRADRNLTVPTKTVVLGRAPGRRTVGPTCARPCGHDSCGPWVTDTVLAPATVTGERDLLSRNLDWIARQPWVDDFAEELTDLLAALRRVNHTTEVPAGVCDSFLPDGSECGGKVWHVMVRPDGKIGRADAPGPDDEPGFRCGSCRRITTGTEAVRQRDRMWRAEQARKTEKGKISS